MSAKFLFLRSSPTAGPETSARSPRAHESLTVITAAVRLSGVEEDIFFFLRWFPAVPLRLVELAQTFHQQALGVEVRGLLGALAFEVDLKVSVRPAEYLEYGRIPDQRAIGGVRHLAFFEVQFAFVVFVGKGERTALAA